MEDTFHASKDEQRGRGDAIFYFIKKREFCVGATILEKRKLEPHLYPQNGKEQDFYKFAWYYHFKYIAQKMIKPDDKLLVVKLHSALKREEGLFVKALKK